MDQEEKDRLIIMAATEAAMEEYSKPYDPKFDPMRDVFNMPIATEIWD